LCFVLASNERGPQPPPPYPTSTLASRTPLICFFGLASFFFLGFLGFFYFALVVLLSSLLVLSPHLGPLSGGPQHKLVRRSHCLCEQYATRLLQRYRRLSNSQERVHLQLGVPVVIIPLEVCTRLCDCNVNGMQHHGTRVSVERTSEQEVHVGVEA
jgi:hypothetical protein